MSLLDWVGKLFNFFDKGNGKNLSNYDIAKMAMDKVEKMILAGEDVSFCKVPLRKLTLHTEVCESIITIYPSIFREYSISIKEFTHTEGSFGVGICKVRHEFSFDGTSLPLTPDSYRNLMQAFELFSKMVEGQEDAKAKRKIINKISKLK